MIRAMLWKEWREQRMVALSVLSFAALALSLTAQFADSRQGGNVWEGGGPKEMMALALAYLAGAVSGAILLADEKEVGTLEFLDTLPCRRRTIWVGKALAGGFLALVQCTFIALLAVALGSIDDRIRPQVYGLLVLLVGLLAFAWGAFGGALARSTLGAVFQGSVISFAVGLLLMIPFVFVFGPRGFSRPFGIPLWSYYGCWVGLGLLGSAVFFTRLDRRRRVGRRSVSSERTLTRKPRFAGLRALTWLTARQAVFVSLGSAAVAILVGAILLAPDSQPLFVWPGTTLAIGVLAGVTTLSEEQVRGVARFWAERRLPLGRLWAVKTAFHFALAAVAALILWLFIYAGSTSIWFRSRLTMELRPEYGRFLLLGLVYGFVVGHLAGMVFRKTVVAGLVATVTAATLAGLILPSVIGGGAATWQVWAPAAVLLVTARLLLYPWATERVATRGPVLRAAGGTLAALLVLAAGIGYRVVEIPSRPDRLAESGYADRLPPFEENKVGRAVNAASTHYRTVAWEARDDYPGQQPPAGVNRRAFPAGPGLDPITHVLRSGWSPESGALLDRWLDRVFAAKWLNGLEEHADEPPGVFVDPRNVDFFSPPDDYLNLQDMIRVLRVRAMQRQAAGEPEAFPRLLRAGLTAVRTARNGAGIQAADAALNCERILLAGLPDWLDEQDGRPDLVRRVLTELDRHEAHMPTGTTDIFWAEQLILRYTMDRVGTWLPRVLDPKPDRLESADSKADAEANLVAFAWQVPWEWARRDRLLRYESGQAAEAGWLSPLHQPRRWSLAFERTGNTESDARALTLRRLARLRVALRLFDLDHGRPAPTLSALVPDYLPAVPDDPFTGRPFGYRVSAGETILAGRELPSREEAMLYVVTASLAHPAGGLNGMGLLSRLRGTGPDVGLPAVGATTVRQSVPPGYAVVWSAGPDGSDNGGRQTGPRGDPRNRGEDWVVVIRPATARPAR